MSISTFIADGGQLCSIQADSTADQPAQTNLGGADRSVLNWVTVADAVPCLVEIVKTTVEYNQNNQRTYLTDAIIYFDRDPVPGGMSIRDQVVITATGTGGPRIGGTWAIMGIDDPVPSGHHLEVSCRRTGLP